MISYPPCSVTVRATRLGNNPMTAYNSHTMNQWLPAMKRQQSSTNTTTKSKEQRDYSDLRPKLSMCYILIPAAECAPNPNGMIAYLNRAISPSLELCCRSESELLKPQMYSRTRTTPQSPVIWLRASQSMSSLPGVIKTEHARGDGYIRALRGSGMRAIRHAMALFELSEKYTTEYKQDALPSAAARILHRAAVRSA